MQSISHQKNEPATLQQKFLGYLMNCRITMLQMMDYPYLQVKQLINKSRVILTLGNNAILIAYQINTRYNTYAHDGALCHIN